jgi:putative hydrolase of the HAD superfamily
MVTNDRRGVMQEPQGKIKAVLFDLGETLLNFGKVDVAAIFREGARLSYDYLKSQGQSIISLRARCWLSSLRGKDFDALTVFKKIGTKKGIKLSEQQWQYYAWLWYEPLSKVGRLEPRAIETLTKLQACGLKLGIVSNTFINVSSLEKHLKQLGILDFFGVRLFSCQFDFRKPSGKIFKVAADRIGEMFQNILFVGDRIDNDIIPAVRAGMYAVLKAAYTNAGKNPPKGICRINQLSELPGLIERINGREASDCCSSLCSE